jgi:hypothetical protein
VKSPKALLVQCTGWVTVETFAVKNRVIIAIFVAGLIQESGGRNKMRWGFLTTINGFTAVVQYCGSSQAACWTPYKNIV